METLESLKSELDLKDQQIENLRSEAHRLRQRDREYQRLLDKVTSEVPRPVKTDGGQNRFDGLSFIIAYYNIPRQIERTIISCSPEYQNAPSSQMEVIIVDNGSQERPPEDLQDKYPHVTKILRTEDKPSPVSALNAAIREAKFSNIALMIDGAHMLSPGIFENARDICYIYDLPVINVPQYLLGFVAQNLASRDVDPFRRESNRLKHLNWPEDGYRLFEYSVYPGENYQRSYFGAIESNCLITTKEVLETCGGFDERFDEPGAGFANLELFSRLIHRTENTYVILPGEGSFHQDHGGTTTGNTPDERERLVEEYKKRYFEITGSEIIFNVRSPILHGLVRRTTQMVPMISRDYGRAKVQILKQLADVYVARTNAGIKNAPPPKLAFTDISDEQVAHIPLKPLGLLDREKRFSDIPQKNFDYLNLLRKIHQKRKPELYLEIGVGIGSSMSLANCRSVGVDPAFHISKNIPATASLFRTTSCEFFADTELCNQLFQTGIDLAFIDGMHLAEYVVRDFLNVEKLMKRDGLIVIDDVLPEQMVMAERNRKFNAWSGDVYKLLLVLKKYRPDLQINVFEAFIGAYRKGLGIVSNLDPESNILAANYDQIEQEIIGDSYAISSIEHLEELLQLTPYTLFESVI